MERIPVQLEEQIQFSDHKIPVATLDLIHNIVKSATEAAKLKSHKEKLSDASTREIENIIAELLNNPGGLSKHELLACSESDNLSSLVLRIKNYLRKSDYEFILSKRRANSSTVYILMPNK